MASVEHPTHDRRLLLIDGFRSTFEEARDWANKIGAGCPETSLWEVDTYSYDPTSANYEAQATHISVLADAKDMDSWHSRHLGATVPIAYSLGGPLAIRGTRSAVDGYPAVTVPKIVLIAPAFWPHRAMQRLYGRAGFNARAIVELADPSEYVHRILYRDLRGFLEDQTKIVVLHSSLDSWCLWDDSRLPQEVRESPLLRAIDMHKEIPRPRGMGEIDYHKLLKDHGHTIDLICEELVGL